jgi:hypothetical protein
MSDLEQRLTDHLRCRAAAATPRYDLAGIEQRGLDRAVVELTGTRRRSRPSLWVAVAAVFALVVLVGALTLVDDHTTVDVGPAGPTEVSVPSWPGPVRAPSDVVHSVAVPDGEELTWEDPLDASEPWADITGVGFAEVNQGSWRLDLGAAAKRLVDLDPGVVVAYGLVLDTDADGAADYVAGISNEAPRRGDVRTWVTNLATGETQELVGPPYGLPVEFHYPSPIVLTILGTSTVPGLDPTTVRFYAWTSVARDGVVYAHDYAPDTGWLSAQPS